MFRTKRQRIVCDIIPGSIKRASLKKKKIIQLHNVTSDVIKFDDVT